MLVLYLSYDRIQAATGSGGAKASISDLRYSVELNDCMFNGMVTEKEEFCKRITTFFEHNSLPKKDVTLIINSNQIITRIMKVPVKNDEGTLEYISNEFSDVERAETPVYAFSVLTEDKKTKLRQILAALTDKSFVQGYVDLFQSCGIQITRMIPFLCAAVRGLNASGRLYQQTAVIQMMESAGFNSLLFVEGQYTYSTYNRIFNEHGTSGFGMEVARAVNRIEQFTKAQHIEQNIQSILLAGFDQTDEALCSDVIESMSPGLQVRRLEGGGGVRYQKAGLNLGSCLGVIGGFLPAVKGESLLMSLNKGKKSEKKVDGFLIKAALILGSVLAVMILLTVGVMTYRWGVRNELNTIVSYNSSETIQSQVTYYDALTLAQADYQQRLEALQTTVVNLQTYPLPSSTVNHILDACAEGLVSVEVQQYNSATGQLQINVTTPDVDKINLFVDMLTKNQIFDVQAYTGYLYREESNEWSVNISLNLDASAGR